MPNNRFGLAVWTRVAPYAVCISCTFKRTRMQSQKHIVDTIHILAHERMLLLHAEMCHTRFHLEGIFWPLSRITDHLCGNKVALQINNLRLLAFTSVMGVANKMTNNWIKFLQWLMIYNSVSLLKHVFQTVLKTLPNVTWTIYQIGNWESVWVDKQTMQLHNHAWVVDHKVWQSKGENQH